MFYQESLLTTLENWGFEVARPRLPPTTSAEELIDFHRRVARDRQNLGYAVDGVVYKLDSLKLQVRWVAKKRRTITLYAAFCNYSMLSGLVLSCFLACPVLSCPVLSCLVS